MVTFQKIQSLLTESTTVEKALENLEMMAYHYMSGPIQFTNGEWMDELDAPSARLLYRFLNDDGKKFRQERAHSMFSGLKAFMTTLDFVHKNKNLYS